jgi:hypothetical protein
MIRMESFSATGLKSIEYLKVFFLKNTLKVLEIRVCGLRNLLISDDIFIIVEKFFF